MTNAALLPTGSSLGSQGLSGLSLGIQRETRREVERVQSRAVTAKLAH